MQVTPDIEERWAKELFESRICFKTEMQRVLNCFDHDDKRKLLADWKLRYTPERVQALIQCAADKRHRVIVANWNIQQLSATRIKDHIE